MYHADAGLHCVMRRLYAGISALYEYFPVEAAGRVYDRHAEEYVHKRGFPRSVLSDQRVYLAFFNFETDI